MSRQSKFAPALLELVTTFALQDKKYVNRLKRHYQMFRKAIEQEPGGKKGEHKHSPGWLKQKYQKLMGKIDSKKPQKSESPKPASTSKVGRNAPCPFGSGKKYKKCCGK